MNFYFLCKLMLQFCSLLRTVTSCVAMYKPRFGKQILVIIFIGLVWICSQRKASRKFARSILHTDFEKLMDYKTVHVELKRNDSNHSITSTLALSMKKDMDCKLVRSKISYQITPSMDTYSTCEKSSCFKNKSIDWNLVSFVKSYAYNFEQRKVIRRTWGSYRYLNGGMFRKIFILGAVGPNTQSKIAEESRRYGDILQIDKVEETLIVSRKTLAGMQWAADNLPDDFLYASADGDFLINLGEVQETIDKYIEFYTKRNWPEFPLICMAGIRFTVYPNRKPTSKDYVSRRQYKWPYYPKFCLGGMYVTTVKVARLLYDASRTEEQLNRDDVWVTGILRMKIGMNAEMVLNVQPVPAHHYHAQYQRISENAGTFLSKEWKEILATFHNLPHCRCVSD